jgi:hypothetical protein
MASVGFESQSAFVDFDFPQAVLLPEVDLAPRECIGGDVPIDRLEGCFGDPTR